MAKAIRKVKQGGNWLARNREPRNYLFYIANIFPVVINPVRGALGLAGRIYEDVFTNSYTKNSHYVNLARAGLAVLTFADTLDYNGVVETLGDAALTSALVTDTSYWKEKFLSGIGRDIKKTSERLKARFD